MKKQMSKYFIISVVVLSLGFVMGVLGLILNQYAVIFLIIAAVLILASIPLLFADKVIAKERKEQESLDEENVIKSLKSYQNNGKLLVKTKSNDQLLQEMGQAVNDIIINDTVLTHGQIYDGQEFFLMMRKFIIKSGLQAFAFASFNKPNKTLSKALLSLTNDSF